MDAGEDARMTAGLETGATNRMFHNYSVTILDFQRGRSLAYLGDKSLILRRIRFD